MEKSEFLSIASHEVKHPLTNIKNATSMALEGSFGEIGDKVKGILSKIFSESEHSVEIIDNYLNISRIEQGRMKYDFGSVDMRKMVSEVFEDSKHKAEEKGNKLQLEIPEGVDFNITCDYGKIKEAVTNIIDNSIKYTEKGLTAVKMERNDTNMKVLISVKDNGIGMSKETIAHLFKRFSRAKNIANKAKEISGTGLGMYITREIVIAHGGRVWAESAGEGKGSTFLLELPFHPTKQEEVETDTPDEQEKT
tara:strand:- start:250 stop:1002 length:753 start_codon:yes stop_codon:yes gene_type:complete